jgi:hypothetical protein
MFRRLESDDTETLWTRDYRIGLAQGLLFDPDEQPTVTPRSLQDALMAIDPLPECADDINGLVDRIIGSTAAGTISSDEIPASALSDFVAGRIAVRPQGEHPALRRLTEHIDPQSS